MLPEEARWLGMRIRSISPDRMFPMLNIGSSTGKFASSDQPWIDQEIFGPLRNQKREVLNTDIKDAPGVDLVGDLADPAFLDRVRSMRFRSVLCSNLLEHVKNRAEIARVISETVTTGGLIFVSGPHAYPFHGDPIDTMFRPTIEEMAALFPNTKIIVSEIVSSGTYAQYITRSPKKFLMTIIRLFLPFYKPVGWYSAVIRLGWLFRKFSATCVVLEKQ